MKTKKEIAIKILKNEKQIIYLKREFYYLKKLEGKLITINFSLGLSHIPKTHDFTFKAKKVFFTMELFGPNLNQHKNISSHNKFNYLLQMVSALEQVHSKGVVHQDIKPSNFVQSLNPVFDTRLFLIDFGLAKTHIDTDGNVVPPNEVKNFVGTLSYASINAHKNIVIYHFNRFFSV